MNQGAPWFWRALLYNDGDVNEWKTSHIYSISARPV